MICCIGDKHIDRFHGIIPNGPKLVLQTIDDIYLSMKNQGVKHFVWLGDVFHTPYPEEESWYGLMDLMHKHRDVETHVIVGNHDMESTDRFSTKFTMKAMKRRWFNGKVYTKPEVVTLCDDDYFFCPHPYITDAPKGVRYAFGHFAFNGARADNGRELATKHEPSGRWILGDFHTPQRGKRFIYVGSVSQVQFNESPEKRVLLIEPDRLREISIKPRLRLGRAHITSLAELKALDPELFWSVSFEGDLIDKVKLHEYPYIVKHTAPSKTTKAARALIKAVQSADPLQDLPGFLRDRHGLSDGDVKVAMKFLKATSHVSA